MSNYEEEKQALQSGLTLQSHFVQQQLEDVERLSEYVERMEIKYKGPQKNLRVQCDKLKVENLQEKKRMVKEELDEAVQRKLASKEFMEKVQKMLEMEKEKKMAIIKRVPLNASNDEFSQLPVPKKGEIKNDIARFNKERKEQETENERMKKEIELLKKSVSIKRNKFQQMEKRLQAVKDKSKTFLEEKKKAHAELMKGQREELWNLQSDTQVLMGLPPLEKMKNEEELEELEEQMESMIVRDEEASEEGVGHLINIADYD